MHIQRDARGGDHGEAARRGAEVDDVGALAQKAAVAAVDLQQLVRRARAEALGNGPVRVDVRVAARLPLVAEEAGERARWGG